MEGSESAMNRVGRVVWTVWGYLTGTVGRYLRPEVTNQDTHNVHVKQEDTGSTSKGSMDVHLKKEEKEKTETKTKEGLQYPGVKVRAAAVEWEKENVTRAKSRHAIDKKLQPKKDIDRPLDNKSESRKTDNIKFTEREDSPEGEEKIPRKGYDRSKEEPIKSEFTDQSLLAKDGDLKGEKSKSNQEQRKEEEEKIKRREFNESEQEPVLRKEYDKTEEEPTESVFIDQDLLADEDDLNVEKNKNSQDQDKKEEEKSCDEIIKKDNEETEEELIKSEFTDESLLALDAYLNVVRSKSLQEQTKEAKLLRTEFVETQEEPIKHEFIDQGLLANEADLNVVRIEANQEQTKKLEEEETILRKEYDKTEEEPVESEFIDQDLLADEVLNVERNKNSQEQDKKEEEKSCEIMKKDTEETQEEPLKSELTDQSLLPIVADLNNVWGKSLQEQTNEEKLLGKEFIGECEFIDQGLLANEADLNVVRSENCQEQERKHEEEDVEDIMRREFKETEDEPIKHEFIDQGLLVSEIDLERNEIGQLQRRKSEEQEKESDDEIIRREFDKTEEEPVNSEMSIDQVLLSNEADPERNEIDQEQRRNSEEEDVNELIRRELDETEEKTIKREKSIDQCLLTKEAGPLEQESEEEEEVECVDETIKRENDEIEQDSIENEFSEQCLLAKEADQYVESSQEERMNQEEDSVHEILRRENDETGGTFIERSLLVKEPHQIVERGENSPEETKEETIMRRENEETEEEPLKSEFIDQGLLKREVDLNYESSENSQEQGRKEEEVVEVIRKEDDETGEEPIKSTVFEQGLLDIEAELNVESKENSQEQRRKSEEEEEEEDDEDDTEGIDEILRRDNDENEEPVKSDFTDEGVLAKEEQEEEEKCFDEVMNTEIDETGLEPIEGEFIDQDLEPEEQASVCDMRDTAEVQEDSMEKIMECLHDEDKKESNVIEQSNQGKSEHENEASKSQMVDEGLFIKLSDNATLLQKEEGNVEVEKLETVEKIKARDHEGFLTWEQFTEQKASETEMTEIKDIDRNVGTECELLEMAWNENADIRVAEPSMMFEDEDNYLTFTTKLQQFVQSKEQKTTSEALNLDLEQFEDKDHDHSGSQPPAVVTKPDTVIIRPGTGTGNQTETVETTSKYRAEVGALDAKKSADRETSSHEQVIAKKEVSVQEIKGQCFPVKGPFLEESDDTRENESSLQEAPFSEIKSVPLDQIDETAGAEIQSSSLQELTECSSEAEEKVEAKSSSSEQTADVFDITRASQGELICEQPESVDSSVENICDVEIPVETTLDDQINQDECTVQDSCAEASSHRLSEALCLSERETVELVIQRDSQKDAEEQESTNEAEIGLLDEIKHVTSCLGIVEEITSGLTKESEKRSCDLLGEIEERKEHQFELESHEEISESNINDELEREKELVAEMTDIESMVVSAGDEMESVEKMDEPINEEEKDKHPQGFSESEASKEIEEHVEHGESVVDGKQDVEERDRLGLKRGFEQMAGHHDKDKPSVLTDLLLPSQVSSLDFTVQKSKIAVKNPLVRPPKDPRTLINMVSVEPLISPHASQPSFLKKSHIQGDLKPTKGVIGFRLPGLAAGFPELKKTEAGRKIRDGEDSESITSQKSDSQAADDSVKQETAPHKPKWTPPKHPGMGGPMMMAELKSKLKKPAKE